MKDNIAMPAETTVSALAVKAIASLGLGTLGGVIMAIFDPPKDRKTLFLQALCAGLGSLIFGPGAVQVLDHFLTFVDVAAMTIPEALEWVAPVYFLVGSMSWGLFAALAKLRNALRDKGAEEVLRRLDVQDKLQKETPKDGNP